MGKSSYQAQGIQGEIELSSILICQCPTKHILIYMALTRQQELGEMLVPPLTQNHEITRDELCYFSEKNTFEWTLWKQNSLFAVLNEVLLILWQITFCYKNNLNIYFLIINSLNSYHLQFVKYR